MILEDISEWSDDELIWQLRLIVARLRAGYAAAVPDEFVEEKAYLVYRI